MNAHKIASMILEDARKLRVDAERLRRCDKQEDAHILLQSITSSVQALATKYTQLNGSSLQGTRTVTPVQGQARSMVPARKRNFFVNLFQSWYTRAYEEKDMVKSEPQKAHGPVPARVSVHQWRA